MAEILIPFLLTVFVMRNAPFLLDPILKHSVVLTMSLQLENRDHFCKRWNDSNCDKRISNGPCPDQTHFPEQFF